MKKTIFLIGLLSLIFFSCTKEIKFKGDIEDPVVVVNALFSPDSVMKVRVIKSMFILDNPNQPTLLEDANVEATINGIPCADFSYDKNGYYVSPTIPNEGDDIDIQVRVPGFDVITASTKVPQRVPIILTDTISWQSSLVLSVGNQKFGILTKYINPEGTNYYRTTLRRYMVGDGGKDTSYCNYNFSINSFYVKNKEEHKVSENIIEMYSDANFKFFQKANSPGEIKLPYSFYSGLRDTLIINRNQKIPVRTDSIVICFESIDENYYKYCETYQRQLDISSGPLADASAIYTNVEGGTGIVGGRIRSVIGFKIAYPAKSE